MDLVQTTFYHKEKLYWMGRPQTAWLYGNEPQSPPGRLRQLLVLQ